MLIECGYSCGTAGADGEFGSGTDAALRKFQKDNSLVVDGQYGPASKLKLTALHNAKVSGNGSESKTPSKTPKWVGAVNTNELNVRTGAGTGNPKLAAYPLLRQHNFVDVCDTIKAADSTDCIISVSPVSTMVMCAVSISAEYKVKSRQVPTTGSILYHLF